MDYNPLDSEQYIEPSHINSFMWSVFLKRCKVERESPFILYFNVWVCSVIWVNKAALWLVIRG